MKRALFMLFEWLVWTEPVKTSWQCALSVVPQSIPIAHCVCAVLGSPGGGGTQVPNCSGSCRSSIPGWQNCVFCGLLIWGPPEEAEGLLHVPGPVSFSSHAVLACMVMALTKSSCLTATFFLHRLRQFKRSCAISFVQVSWPCRHFPMPQQVLPCVPAGSAVNGQPSVLQSLPAAMQMLVPSGCQADSVSA